ncbi:MAG TPA: amidohydrolase family protein [Longimicrobiales bacterium]|nr:amidohydrolase family protein [Longimicrobiales bacterium]
MVLPATLCPRPRLLFPVLLLMLMPASAAALQPADTTRAARNAIQNGLPLAPTRTLEFTTTEGSWISVDITPDGGTLVFDLLGDLYTMPATGGRATPLTRGMAVDAQPRISPDGTRVVFTSDRNGGEGVWIMSLDMQDTVQVTRGREVKYDSPTWTPDGNYIIVTRGTQLHMYHVDGGTGTALTRTDVGAAANQRFMGATVTPDGREIWAARRTGQWQYNTALPDYQLVVYNRETGDITQRTSRGGSAFRPTLSPDGRWLVFGTRYNAETGLRIRDLQTGDERWLAYPVQRDDQESRATLDVYPGMTFTPDSRHLIAFYGGKLWRIPVDGSAPANIPFEVDVVKHMGPAVHFQYRVEDDPTFTVRQVRDAVPSPDGRRLAFVALDRLYLMDYPGGTPRRVTTDDSMLEYAPTWSPDGQWLAYATWSDATGEGHIQRVRATPGSRGQRLTTSPAVYGDLAYNLDGSRIVATRAYAQQYLDDTSRGGSEFVWVPATGGDATFMAPTSGRGRPHFRADTPDRIYVYGGGRLATMRWDGTEMRDVLRIGGSGAGTQNASLIVMAPHGDQALAQVGADIYAVTVPMIGGPAPQVSVTNPNNAPFPARKLTDIGGQFPAWSADGRTVHWTIGNAHFAYDLDRAKAFEDSVRAARAAAPADTTPADPVQPDSIRTDTAQAAGDTARAGRSDEPRYEPVETRVVITAQRDIPQGTAVLRGGRAITMRGDEVIEDADIVVRNNRIVAVGRRGTVDVPDDASVIDVAGRTVMPGFVDTHAHLRARGLPRDEIWAYAANLAFGVTTTRDPQTGNTDVLSYEDRVRTGEVLGPRIYSTGPGVFSGENIQNLDHARRVLKRYSEYYDTKTIKQYVTGNRQQRQWVIMAAQELGLMPTTEGSLDIEKGITEAIDGYSGHEHNWPAFPHYSDLTRMFAFSGVVYTPTILVAYGGPWAENYFYATEDVLGDAKLARFTPHEELAGKARRRDVGWFHPDEHVFTHIGEQVADFVAAGGKAGVGSHGQLQGIAWHWELWAMASGGLSNHDALRVATIMGAEGIGLGTDLGSIEPGKLADLVVLDGNPLDNLRNTNTVRYVMMNGRLYNADTLAEMWPRVREAPRFYWQGQEPNTAAGIR